MRISASESRVMAVLWQLGPSTAEEVIAAMPTAVDWQAATVKTLLNRLLVKGAVDAQPEGRRYRYRALLQEQDWKLDESRGLLERLFDGRVAPLVAYFSEHGELSPADLRELRALIDRLDDGR
jgi:BlaI family transcriptional regulator, penicillinase repressor